MDAFTFGFDLMFPAPRAAYVHIPFCRHRCGYCNFTVVVGRHDLQSSLLDALEIELAALLKTPRPVDTVFIGGGTPTELTLANLQRLCRMLREWFVLSDGYEWSIEANPSDLNPAKMDLLERSGITRISLGAQSFRSSKLLILERDHCSAEIESAVRMSRDRFQSVSIDLIFAVPGESAQMWGDDLEAAIHLAPDHLSTYGLTFEKGARFWNRLARRELVQVDQEQQRVMYELAIDRLVDAGWHHYEISNFARPGHRCRHNEVYWTGDPYFAFGPGAARYVDGCREVNHRSTSTYLRRVLAGQSAVAQREVLSPEERAREQLVFGLRMLAGVLRESFAQRTGFEIDELVDEPLRRFVDLGFLNDTGDRISLTRAGLLISDALWPEFL